MSLSAVLGTMSAEKGNVVAAGARKEGEKTGTVVVTVNRRVLGGNPGDRSGMCTADASTDPCWHVETFMERRGEKLTGRWSPRLAVDD